MANATLLSWINAEVDQALKLVRDDIAKFSASPEDAVALRVCPEHLHQVSGALRMVGLAGATRFCEEIEGCFARMNGEPSAAAVGVIDRAVLALKEFVGDLARGQANVPLRLFPVYKELAALHGKTGPSEKDLFYPEFGLQAPTHPQPRRLAAEELPSFLNSQRSRFQRGLLGWLRGQGAGLDEMRQAVDALHQVAAQLPEPRAVWWVASGFVDALADPVDADWLAASKCACNKIDFLMRDLAAGAAHGNEGVLRELLYALAKAKPVTWRIKEIRQLYQLDSLFPEPPRAAPASAAELDPGALEPAIYDLHSRLDSLKGAWVQYISGEQGSAGKFRELISAFRGKAGTLGNAHVIKLLEAIASAAKHLPDPYPRHDQYMVIEMASAFLLAKQVIDQFTSPPPDIEGQIAILAGWLLDAAQGKSTGEPPAGLRPEVTQQISALQLRAQVSKEILANLQHVEKVLDAYVRGNARQDSLAGLGPSLRQIHGALVVLGFQRAAEALVVCEALIHACAAGSNPQTAEDMDWIAEGISSLAFFLDPCLHGREPSEEALALFFRRYEQRARAAEAPQLELSTEADAPPVPPVEAHKPAAATRPGVDTELLDIFLEEAGEVLGNVEANLPACREQPDNVEALTTIRRGFHTLKGSGRMVGLMDLGEVAWEMEQVMNAWLEQKRPATPGLLQLIALAAGAFGTWLSQLRDGSLGAEIDAQRIVEAARKLKAGEEPELGAAMPVEAAAALPEMQPELSAPAAVEASLGDITLDFAKADLLPPEDHHSGLFDIYTKEAAVHVATLEGECLEWRAAPGTDASHEFMRAAHTLASCSHTAGFPEVGEIAGLIEQWIPFARGASEDDAQTVERAIQRLRAMVDAISLRQPCGAWEDTAMAIRELIGRLKASTPAPAPEAQSPAPQAEGPEVLDFLSLDMPAPPEPTPAPPAPQTDGREKRVMRDDIDEQLLPIFLEEAQELVPQVGADLRDWKKDPQDEQVIQSLRRGLHTLKGSARMAGAIRLGELTHIMESRMEAALESGQFPAELFEDLENRMDRLSSDVERMRAGERPSQAEITQSLPQPEEPAETAQPARPQPKRTAAPARAEAPLPSATAMLRVNADTLDHLITESGEVAIARSRVEAELRTIKQSLFDLSDSITRLRAQLREVEVQADSQMQSRLSVMDEKKGEFDPLEFDRYTRLQELTRLMAESLNDVLSIQQTLLKNLGETDAGLLHQARISRELQQELMRMRAVPFSNLSERLYRIVRQTAREIGKRAEVEIQGAEVELDRSVLERIAAPLEHMLRNALAHGIEAPEQRAAAGKPETGRISLTLRQESNEIALILSDDGGGLNYERLRRKGEEMGLLQPGQAAEEAELAQLIFASGLSTAETVTQLAGRGVGMDVVKAEISAIGGRVDIASVTGQGTTFTIYLPLTLAVTQAVLVRSGATILAISSAMVEQVLRLKSEALVSLYDKRSVDFQGHAYPLHYSQQLLGVTGATEIQTYNSVLLLRSGVQRLALHVDELVGNQEIVVKSIGPQLARVPGVAGATVLPDGGIVLIVNPVHLAQRMRVAPPKALMPAPAAAPVPEKAVPTIMVVDDSLTVRKITSRLLEREGYQVVTAKDGVDALELMKDAVPAVMLVDIEMPRMDGFDLTRNVRNDARTKGVPIIMISSRTAEKHRSQAAQLGVNVFLGKPYQEAELLQQIASYVEA